MSRDFPKAAARNFKRLPELISWGWYKSAREADVLIGFGVPVEPLREGFLTDSKTIGATHAFRSPSPRHTSAHWYGMLVCFNQNVTWAHQDSLLRWRYASFRVALHEFGHVVGFDHPPAGKSVMRVNSFGKSDRLEKADIEGAHRLYGKRE